MGQKKRKSLDKIFSELYTELRNRNEEAIKLVETGQYDNKVFKRVRQWWLEVGKAEYLEEESLIELAEKYRETIETELQRKSYVVV